MAIFTQPKKETAAPASAAPEVTPLGVGGTPAPTHSQLHATENRTALLSLGVNYGGGKTNDVITPNMTMMREYANGILKFNSLPALTTYYAPNEMPSLLHVLQTRMGL